MSPLDIAQRAMELADEPMFEDTEEIAAACAILRHRQERSVLVEHGNGLFTRPSEPQNENHPPSTDDNLLDKNSKDLLTNVPLKKGRARTAKKINDMPEHEYQATIAFMDAIAGKKIEYCEPEVTYLRDDPGFQAFVADNKWTDRAEKKWTLKSDVFDFIKETYSSYLKMGLARSSWVDLDDDLLLRINQKSLANRKKQKFLPTGIPPELNLQLREAGRPSSPKDIQMLAIEAIYQAVNKEKVRLHRENNALSM